MKTLYFNDVKDFFTKHRHLIPETIEDELWDDDDDLKELDPTYWFSECTNPVRDHILTFPGWKPIVQPETGTLIGFELDPTQLSHWDHRIQAFIGSIMSEYDYEDIKPYWDFYNLQGDDDVDYNGGYLDAGVQLILAYFEFAPETK